jgi:hypothetical protein
MQKCHTLFDPYFPCTYSSQHHRPGEQKKAFCVSSLCQLCEMPCKKRFSRWWNDEIVKFHTLSFIPPLSFISEREIQFSDWKVKTFFFVIPTMSFTKDFSSYFSFFNLYRDCGTNTNLWWNMNWISSSISLTHPKK